MSATNETPKVAKKRGRPKKVQEQPTVAAPVQNASAELARKAVEEILSQASSKASDIQVTPVDISGAPTGASSHDNLDEGQADYIPGTRVTDIQMVPKFAFDEDLRRTRRVGLPNDYHYCWVHTDKITLFRVNGYRYVIYSGGSLSGLADGGFTGTGIYEKTFDNHVRNGDMMLMYITMRQYEAMTQEDTDARARLETAGEDSIHNDGYRRGIRTFKEKDGVTIYN